MVNARKIHPDCQIKDVHFIANGPQEPIPLGKSVRLFIRKLLGPRNVRKIKLYTDDFLNWYAKLRGKPIISPTLPVNTTNTNLNAGDQVWVRSTDEIKATLNRWGQLKGCSFAPEMVQYCETSQRVLKRVERFVDERDLRARKTKGIVLLEGIICQGTASLGRCDRNCFFFWREEWLEKIISCPSHTVSTERKWRENDTLFTILEPKQDSGANKLEDKFFPCYEQEME